MMKQGNSIGTLPPPPGLIASITAGFDAIANHIPVIAIPVILDIFLWFGPRLRVEQMLKPVIAGLLEQGSASFSAADLAMVRDIWASFTHQLNLFSFVRTFPVGISSLMAAWMPLDSPLGAPMNIEVTGLLELAGWWIVLALAGWIGGSLYFHWVAQVALKRKASYEPRQMGWAMAQSFLLSLIWLTLLLIATVPFMIVFSVLAFINIALAQALLFLTALLSVWIILPVYFSAHGIFVYGHNAFNAILRALRLIRYTLPTTSLFVLGIIVISQGLDFLWRVPAATSWWAAVGVAGHAFIATALVASSFIYYHDMNYWLQRVFEYYKAQARSVQA